MQTSELSSTLSDGNVSPVDLESFDNVAFFCLEKVSITNFTNLTCFYEIFLYLSDNCEWTKLIGTFRMRLKPNHFRVAF